MLALLSSQVLPFEGLIRIVSQPRPVAAPDDGCTLANQILAADTDQAVGHDIGAIEIPAPADTDS